MTELLPKFSLIHPDELTNSINDDCTDYDDPLPNYLKRRPTLTMAPALEPHEKGKFLYIPHLDVREMLANAYDVISQLNLWERVKFYNDNTGYYLKIGITTKMKKLGYNYHSGYALSWTMLQMNYIALNGEENYRALCG